MKGSPTGSLIYHRSLLFEDISKAEDDTGKDKDKDTEEERQKRTAATKIQAAFRGHHARKSLRVPEASARTGISEEATSEEATGEQLQKEFPDDNQGER